MALVAIRNGRLVHDCNLDEMTLLEIIEVWLWAECAMKVVKGATQIDCTALRLQWYLESEYNLDETQIRSERPPCDERTMREVMIKLIVRADETHQLSDGQ